LAESGAEAVEHVVIVTIDGVDVACLVDAYVDELVPVADCRVGVDINRVVGEADAAVDGYCYPDRVRAA